MPYRYATERIDSSDFASGFVLHSAPDHPAFPVRLATEMLLRARAYLTGPVGGQPPTSLTLWDPCCGSGHLATVLGWCHRGVLGRVIASDVDPDVLTLARKNLALLTPEGLRARARDRQAHGARFGKAGHAAAAQAAHRLAETLEGDGGALAWRAGQADVFDPHALARVVADAPPDIVLTDVPYGEHTHWGGNAPAEPIPALLRSLAGAVPPHAVLAIADRSRRIKVAPLRPLERLKIGTRSVVLLRAAEIRVAAAER